jgi:hypothetical protein
VFGIARIFSEVVIPEENKSGISCSVNCLTPMLGTAMASSISLLFLLTLSKCCKNEFVVIR